MGLRRLLAVACIALSASGLTACSGHDSAGAPTLTVLAAASLSGVLDPLEAELAKDHPGVRVRISYAGSPALVAQVRAGAPADVVITASPGSVAPLVRDELLATPVTIATNHAAVIVPTSNPGQVQSIADLARSALRVALCDPAVPCGAVAQKTLDNAGVKSAPDTLAPDVKTVLRLVQTGEADAGIVYVTDARAAAEKVRVIELPPGVAASTSYPACVVTSSKQKVLAREYIALLTDTSGRQLLHAAGFGTP